MRIWKGVGPFFVYSKYFTSVTNQDIDGTLEMGKENDTQKPDKEGSTRTKWNQWHVGQRAAQYVIWTLFCVTFRFIVSLSFLLQSQVPTPASLRLFPHPISSQSFCFPITKYVCAKQTVCQSFMLVLCLIWPVAATGRWKVVPYCLYHINRCHSIGN